MKVNIIASVVLEIKNNHLFPLSLLNPHQTKRLAIAIELQRYDLTSISQIIIDNIILIKFYNNVNLKYNFSKNFSKINF